MRNSGRLWIVALILVVASLACKTGSGTNRELNLYPSPTIVATQTARIEQITTTPPATTTPIVTVATVTPNATTFCVSATVAVHLRPSPATTNYPIVALPNGSIVADLGGRSGNWYFVAYGDKQGWVDSNYLEECS